jgi:zinc D-Ala-D-Ala carboxypeptidase
MNIKEKNYWKNIMSKISKHISYKEGVYSRTAVRKDIDNTPNEEQLDCMELLAKKVFEPLREWVSGPIKINSFFRCPKLNKAIGGSSRSQHCKGQAIDIDDTFGIVSNADMYYWIKNNLDFDQMIWEFGDDDNPNWVHVSYVSPEDNRNRCLKAYKENGKTKYKII